MATTKVEKLQIVSDGTMFGTKVYGPNGENLSNVIREITFHHHAGQDATATITCYASFEGRMEPQQLQETMILRSNVDGELKEFKQVKP